MKTCASCGESLPTTCFQSSAKTRDGYAHECLFCYYGRYYPTHAIPHLVDDYWDTRGKRLARPPRKSQKVIRRSEIFARYGGTCAYCDAPAEHLDHVIALSLGGADAAHNLLPACAPCNLGKGAKTLAEWAATF